MIEHCSVCGTLSALNAANLERQLRCSAHDCVVFNTSALEHFASPPGLGANVD
jgi:hypothetical protein